MSWFTADKDGLRQIHERLVERRGFGIICGELYQNVRDTNATFCKFTLEKISNAPRMRITVEDDGEGFHDLSHAWTMFAPSLKKQDPTKGGRFNVGEKVVLSFALNARISTTSGTVEFNEGGRKEFPRRKREIGTVFEAELRCNQERYEQCLEYMSKIFPKTGLTLTVNGALIRPRIPFITFAEKLPTEIGDDLKPSMRNTEVEVYKCDNGETAMLYELGIPVVETDDQWHYNVLQKVPLNVDRDNVTPAYLKTVRVFVYNHTFAKITSEEINSTWVNEATSDKRCNSDAAKHFLTEKYGENVVAATPNDRQADCEAMAKGDVVIPPKGLTPGQRDNVRDVLLSSAKKYPYASKKRGVAEDWRVLHSDELTSGMLQIQEYTEELGRMLLGQKIRVEFFHSRQAGCAATYGDRKVSFNVFSLGENWFSQGITVDVDDLILHELAHEYESNHLDSRYHKALSNLGAKLKKCVLENFDWFKLHQEAK